MTIPRGNSVALALLVVIQLAAVARARAEPGSGPVLLVLAHPDDETMIGATLGRLKQRGVPVYALVVTRGEGGKLVRLSTDGRLRERDPVSARALASTRTIEMQRAAAWHGFRGLFWLSSGDAFDYPDRASPPRGRIRRAIGAKRGGLAFLAAGIWDEQRLRRDIVRVAQRVRPEVVITTLPAERRTHVHHQAVGRVVRDLYGEGRLGERARALYGIVEHDWYRGIKAKRKDLRLPRAAWSAHAARGAAMHASQNPAPRNRQALRRAGRIPETPAYDALRRLDRGRPTVIERMQRR